MKAYRKNWLVAVHSENAGTFPALMTYGQNGPVRIVTTIDPVATIIAPREIIRFCHDFDLTNEIKALIDSILD